jgi:hypothetical protein
MRIVIWGDKRLADKALKEFQSDNIVIVDSFDLFKAMATHESLNLFSMSLFTNFDQSGFTESVAQFIHDHNNIVFHAFLDATHDDQGWELGRFDSESNVVTHMILDIKNEWTIKRRLELD